GDPCAARDRPEGSPPGQGEDARRPVRLPRSAQLGRTRLATDRTRHRIGSGAGAATDHREGRTGRRIRVRRDHRQRPRSHCGRRTPIIDGYIHLRLDGNLLARTARRHHQSSDRRSADRDRFEVRTGLDRCQARPPDQLLLRPAAGGTARERRSSGDPRDEREAAVDRSARGQRVEDRRPRGLRSRLHPGHDRTGAAGTGQQRRRDRLQRPVRTVLGVAGGIAAYKAGHIIRRPRELDHSVKVVPTANALSFVGAPTFEALSGQSVTTDVLELVQTGDQVLIGQEAELVIIAPATANLIAKIAAGLADDLLTATVLTTTAEVVVAPAMHTEMWHNPATAVNIATLRSRGI